MANKTTHDLTELTVRQLKTRRRRLARGMPDLEAVLQGSVVAQGRSCGKEGCRCTRGELHGPYMYVVLPRSGGRARTVYVPSGAAEAVRRGASASTQVRAALEAISAVNIELLARGELA